MSKKQSLTARIIAAFFIMTLVVGGMFTAGLIAVVHRIEQQFMTRELEENMDLYLSAGFSSRSDFIVKKGVYLFDSQRKPEDIPAEFRRLGLGYHEVVDEHQAWHVLVRQVNGQKFILAENQDILESRERRLYEVVLASYAVSLILAFALGWILSKRVIKPVIKLAALVRGKIHDPDKPHASLAPEFANDEVGQLAHAFDEAISALYQTLQRERLFTSDVSHELRTPLMVISSSAELIRETTQLDVQPAKHLQRIMSATQEMQSIVDTFLLLARSEQQQDQVKGRLTLTDVAQEQIIYLQSEAAKKNLNLELVSEADSPILYADAYLRAVISNLLRNAINYTSDGYVRLIIGHRSFRVEDTGPGIPVDDQASIFHPFKRGSNSTGEGLGLGLSLVERICQHQGWSVSVSTLKPHGTSFQVHL